MSLSATITVVDVAFDDVTSVFHGKLVWSGEDTSDYNNIQCSAPFEGCINL